MNAYIDTLLDKKGQKFYPKTKTSAVYDDDNNTLDSVIANKLDKYTSGSSDWDSTPTQNSTKAVTSGGVYQAIDNSTSNKLDKYTSGSSDWDTAPTQNSTKAVTSGGVYQAIDDVKDDLGDPSSASAVTGDDAFSKISTLNSELANFQTFTAQSPSSVSGSKTTALPTGFNGGNCVIIGAKIELISNFYYSVATLAQNGVDLVLSGTTVYITTSATTPSNYLGKDIVIALYKYA